MKIAAPTWFPVQVIAVRYDSLHWFLARLRFFVIHFPIQWQAVQFVQWNSVDIVKRQSIQVLLLLHRLEVEDQPYISDNIACSNNATVFVFIHLSIALLTA